MSSLIFEFIIIALLKFLVLFVPLLIAIAYFTLIERKLLGAMQKRKGPNVVGYGGLLQPLADGLKLLIKETIIPSGSNKFLFILAPVLAFFLSLLGWLVIPFGETAVISDLNLGILYLFAISSLGVYGVILAGWSSNSRYAFLGALRSAAQMVSYEVSFGIIVLSVALCVGSFSLVEIVLFQEGIWLVIPLFPMFLMFFISVLAETNRAPFDLPEAEAELVSGYSVEYSAMGFALFFLGEYSNMILMSTLTVVLFFGGWTGPFDFIPGIVWYCLKLVFVLFLFIWVRAAFPRYRYDQLMRLGWKVFLPFSLGWFLFVASILYAFDWLPY